MGQKKTSPWVWVGIGCLAVFALGGTCVVGSCLFISMKSQQFAESMNDPEKRAEGVLEVLGTDELPEGYHPVVSFSVPFLMKTAIISSESFQGEDDMGDAMHGERGMVFFEMIRMGQDMEELRDYVSGKSDNARVLRDNGIHVDVDEIIGRGVIDTSDGELLYVTGAGGVSAGGGMGSGLVAIVVVDCDADSRGRMAIWWTPDPGSREPEQLVGTAADENSIGDFMNQFSFCG